MLACRRRWGLIPTEVDRLVRLIGTSGARGVVLVSGDRHTGGFYRLPRGQAFMTGGAVAPYDIFEVTSSSLTHSFRTTEQEPGPNRIGDLTRASLVSILRPSGHVPPLAPFLSRACLASWLTQSSPDRDHTPQI